MLKDSGAMSLEETDVTGFERGVVISGGKSVIEKSELKNNTIGLDVHDGGVAISHSNLFDNTQSELRTASKLVLEENYLGAAAVTDLRLGRRHPGQKSSGRPVPPWPQGCAGG